MVSQTSHPLHLQVKASQHIAPRLTIECVDLFAMNCTWIMQKIIVKKRNVFPSKGAKGGTNILDGDILPFIESAIRSIIVEAKFLIVTIIEIHVDVFLM